MTENALTVPEQAAEIIAEIPYVKEAVGTVFVPAKIGGRKSVNLVGVPASKFGFFNVKLINGTLPSGNGKEIVIDWETAKALGIAGPGPVIRVSVKYGALYFRDSFKVVGIMEAGSGLSKLFGASFALVPRKPVQKMLEREGFINYIFVKVEDRKLIDPVARAIRRTFPGANIIKETDIVGVVLKVMDIINGTLMAVTIIGLLVAALGVMNTVMMSIRERIREIGILKTIGAKDRYIMLIFLLEVVMMGTAGGLLGIIAGYLGSYGLRDFIRGLGMPFDIPINPVPEAFILGFTVSVMVSLAAALYPIYRVVKLRPMEALKIE